MFLLAAFVAISTSYIAGLACPSVCPFVCLVSELDGGARGCSFPTDSCKFLTEETTVLEISLLPISPKWVFSTPNFEFVDENFLRRRIFSGSLKFGSCPCPTTPLPVWALNLETKAMGRTQLVWTVVRCRCSATIICRCRILSSYLMEQWKTPPLTQPNMWVT